MAIFTNYATLSYSGGSTVSNTVTGEILDTLAVTKTAVIDNYTARDNITYVITLVNSGTTALTGLSLTDNMGAYQFNDLTYYPLNYTDGSVRYYVNGVLQAAPAVAGGPPMIISGMSVPAGGNATLVYEAAVTNYAPLASGAAITNTATVTGNELSAPVTATETITARNRADLTISKSVCPVVVTGNGQLTYTFVIENTGNTIATASDNVILNDTFNPILNPISVAFNGVAWTAGANYTYNDATGEFATLPGQITVPAATYTQNSNGTWLMTPGIATLTVTGTV